MAVNVASLVATLDADTRGFERKFTSADRRIDQFDRNGRRATDGLQRGLQQSERRFGGLGRTIRRAGGVLIAAFGARKIAQTIGASVNAAADLDESINAIQVVLGEGADSFLKFGRDASNSLGITQQALNQAVVPMGSLLANAGLQGEELSGRLQELSTRATDVASVFNTDVNDVMEAFGAALRRETEPARRFGVNINEAAIRAEALASGLVETEAEINDAIKTQAAFNLIMKESDRTAGDFAKTADSLPNLMRRIGATATETRAAFGRGLLEPSVDSAAALLDGLENLQPVMEDAGREIGRSLGPSLETLVENGMELAESAIPAIVRGVSALEGPLESVADTLGVVATTLDAVNKAGDFLDRHARSAGLAADAHEDLVAQVEALAQSGQTSGAAFDDMITDLRLIQDFGGLGQFENLNDGLRAVTFGLVDMQTPAEQARSRFEAMDDVLSEMVAAGNAKQAREMVSGFTAAAEEQGREVGSLVDLLPKYADATGIVSDETKSAAAQNAVLDQAMSILSTTTFGTGRSMDELAESYMETRGSARDLEESVESLIDRINEAAGVALDAESADIRFRDSLADLNDELAEGKRTLDLSTEAGRRNREAFIAAAEDALGHAEAMAENGATTGEVTRTLQAHSRQLREAGRAAGFDKDQINELLRSFNLLPDQIRTRVDVDVRNALRDIERVTGAVARATQTHGIEVGHGRGRFVERAHGGPLAAGQTALVGEEGPELFRPDTAGTVIPNGQLGGGGGFGGGGGLVIENHIAGSVITERDLTEVIQANIRDFQRRNGRTGFDI